MFRIKRDAAKVALIRAARSTPPLGVMNRVLISLTLFLVATSVARSQCLAPNPETVTLDGVIFSKDFPGPPNYRSIRAGDERMRYWILRLARPVCVESGYEDFLNTRVTNVRQMQLLFTDDSFYNRYRTFVRQRARFRVVGSLYHQQTGHHVTKVLLNVKSLTTLRK